MTKTYTRRTPEQVIADCEAKIEAVKAKEAARSAKKTPEGVAFVAAARLLLNAQATAKPIENHGLDQALDAAREAMSAYAEETGLQMPKRRTRSPRRSEETAAA